MATYDKEYIIRYVDNELTEEERRKFETDLQTDPSLAAELSLYKELMAELQLRLPPDDQRVAILDTLKGLNKQYFSLSSNSSNSILSNPTGSAKRVVMMRWIGGMAAAASVVFVTLLLWPSTKSDDLDRLGKTEMISTTERGGTTDSLMQEASVYFNLQEFKKALPLLDRAVRKDSSSQLALFYRGVAAWHTGAIGNARKDLGKVYENRSILQYEAAFYMALSYATQNNSAAAKEWLKKIPDGVPLSDKAKKLAGKLK